MIKAWVVVGEGSIPGGPFVFPALPQPGMTIRIQDDEGFKHNLEVVAVELDGFREVDWSAARDVGGEHIATLFCKAA